MREAISQQEKEVSAFPESETFNFNNLYLLKRAPVVFPTENVRGRDLAKDNLKN